MRAAPAAPPAWEAALQATLLAFSAAVGDARRLRGVSAALSGVPDASSHLALLTALARRNHLGPEVTWRALRAATAAAAAAEAEVEAAAEEAARAAGGKPRTAEGRPGTNAGGAKSGGAKAAGAKAGGTKAGGKAGGASEPAALTASDLDHDLDLPCELWASRWSAAKSAVELDVDSDDDTHAAGGQLIPFGSVVAVSGRSVRVTVACSAGLAAELPVWGLQLRGDAEWAVRAFRPVRVRVLREGERALLQAG